MEGIKIDEDIISRYSKFSNPLRRLPASAKLRYNMCLGPPFKCSCSEQIFSLKRGSRALR